MEVKLNNTYLMKGIGTQTELKHMYQDCLHLCKARTAHCNSLSGYQEYRGAPAGEGGVKAGTGMAHQMMGPNFTR